MKLNDFGRIVQFTWEDLINHINDIELGPFVIMPNHIHAIIHIIAPANIVEAGSVRAGSVRAGSEPAPTDFSLSEPAPTDLSPSEPARTPTIAQTPLSEIVRQLKTFSAKRINLLRKSTGEPVWQRNYYEHIIRNNESYQKIGDYILTNPIQWENDRYYSGGTP